MKKSTITILGVVLVAAAMVACLIFVFGNWLINSNSRIFPEYTKSHKKQITALDSTTVRTAICF